MTICFNRKNDNRATDMQQDCLNEVVWWQILSLSLCLCSRNNESYTVLNDDGSNNDKFFIFMQFLSTGTLCLWSWSVTNRLIYLALTMVTEAFSHAFYGKTQMLTLKLWKFIQIWKRHEHWKQQSSCIFT